MSAPGKRGRTALAKWIDIPLLWIGAVGLVSMMVLTVLSSIGNTFFSRPVPDIVTIDEVLMAFVVFLPLAYVQLGRHHIEVTLATDWLPPSALRWVKVFAMVVMLVTFSLLAWALGVSAWEAFHDNDVYTGEYTIPSWPWRAIAALGAAAMILRLLIDLFHTTVFGDDGPGHDGTGAG
jgi:TRAP-type C4-dicarboxylate transport system permease small subunit